MRGFARLHGWVAAFAPNVVVRVIRWIASHVVSAPGSSRRRLMSNALLLILLALLSSPYIVMLPQISRGQRGLRVCVLAHVLLTYRVQ